MHKSFKTTIKTEPIEREILAANPVKKAPNSEPLEIESDIDEDSKPHDKAHPDLLQNDLDSDDDIIEINL